MIWTEKTMVDAHLCDSSGIARPSGVLRYLQSAANLQLHHLGPSNELLWDEHKAFLLSRMAMSLYRPLHAYDEIEISTWACESRGVTFNRCGRIVCREQVMAEYVTAWALIDTDTRKLLRVGDITMNFTTEEMLSLDVPTRIRFPRDLDPVLVGERTVMYSDIDRNGHMNNTNYPDMLCDYLPMKDKRTVTCSISFLSEAPLGETLKIYLAEYDDVYYFRTIKSDGKIGIEAEIVLDGID